MYTYLENITEVKKRYNFPYNLIGKVKDIVYCRDGSIPYYKFTLYNDNCDEEFTCIVKESLFEHMNLEESDSIVIEYAPINKFMDIDDCFLVRRMSKPVMGLTGNKSDDIIQLMEMSKKLIESEFADGRLVQGRHSQVNVAYLKYRKA